MSKHWALGIALAVSIGGSFAVQADDVAVPDEYDKLIQQRSRIGMLAGDFFGDRVGLATGSFEIVQTDVDLPGNDALRVSVGRRFVAGANHRSPGHFFAWDLDIPHLHGMFFSVQGWVVSAGSGDADKRCSKFAPPPETMVQDGVFSADEFWQGNSLYLPGSGDQEMLRAPLGTTGDVPSDGNTYPVVTKDGAVARCTTSLATTSESGSQGEGFIVVTPDGTTYRFDQMASRLADRLTKPNPDPQALSARRARAAGAMGVTDTT